MVKYFEWQESYSVGVSKFDDSHKKLLGFTNAFVSACMEEKPMNHLTGLLTEIIRYTRYHFRDEEDLLKETGYELFESHRNIHDKLFDQVLEYINDFFQERVDRSKITEFMMEWLLTHILEEDKKYEEHLRKLGIH